MLLALLRRMGVESIRPMALDPSTPSHIKQIGVVVTRFPRVEGHRRCVFEFGVVSTRGSVASLTWNLWHSDHGGVYFEISVTIQVRKTRHTCQPENNDTEKQCINHNKENFTSINSFY